MQQTSTSTAAAVRLRDDQVAAALTQNGGRRVTSNQIQRAIVRREIPAPPEVDGARSWTSDYVVAAAVGLGITQPEQLDAIEAYLGRLARAQELISRNRREVRP